MSLIDDIRRDREEGTPGPWDLENGTITHPLEVSGCLLAHFSKDRYAPPHRAANTRRIARVPAMEAALLLATDALRKLDYWFDTDPEILDAMTDDERPVHLRMHAIVRAALAAMEESK